MFYSFDNFIIRVSNDFKIFIIFFCSIFMKAINDSFFFIVEKFPSRLLHDFLSLLVLY